MVPSSQCVIGFAIHKKRLQSKTGISEVFIQLLKLKILGQNYSKYCFILIDEMSLKKGLYYNRKKDQIEGFEDLGDKRTSKIADSALCVMACGIVKKWQQAIGYYFTSGPATTPFIQHVIEDAISSLEDAGFVVFGITTDQGPNFEKAFKILGATVSHPVISINKKEYHVHRDPPHLIKNARNFFVRK